MTDLPDCLIRFVRLFSGFGIALVLLTRLYSVYKDRLPGIFQYSFLFGKIKPRFEAQYEVLRVPKGWFRYFYVVGMISTLTMIFVECRENVPHSTMILSLGVFLTHVTRRFYESVYVSRSNRNQMSLTHFLLGIFYYAIVPFAFHGSRADTVHRGPFAIMLFVGQMAALQVSQHLVFRQLADLRKPHSGKSDENVADTYFAPTGSMFQHISCPHYLFEMALYLSLHCFLTTRWTLFSHIVIFVFSNQICSAWLTHSWYQEHFPEWAATRAALVPYVF